MPTYETSGILTQELFTVLRERFPHRIIELDARGRSAVVENLAGQPSSVEARSTLRPEGLLGASLDWLIVDEAAKIKPAVWRECLVQRLTDRDGWALLASTPAGEGDWFHGEFVRAREGDVAYEAWSMPSWANPAIDRAIVEAEAARLSEAEYFSQFAGEFVPATGRICPTCRWGEANDGRVLSIQEWGRCTACPDCERPIDEFGRPVGLMNAEGDICVSTMGHVLDEPAPGDHPDPILRAALSDGVLGT